MSTITELPTVNFDAYPGYDEFKFLHSTYSEEFRARSIIANQWGIVDTGYDPATAPFTAGRSLLVTVSPVNSLTIDIAAGYAITASHLLVNINAVVPSVPLPSLASGNIYVVAVEYTLVASPQQRVNRFGDLTEVRLERPSNIPPGGGASTLIEAITVVNINDYNNPGIFPDDRKQNVVVIAIVSCLTDVTTSQLYLSIDLTRNSYSFNRPWFTVRDVDHRSKVGSGIITDKNTHGIDLQDLSSAGLTLYQQLKPRGGILAKDVSYYGYAGKICTEEINLSRWEADYKGTITSPPNEPAIGGRYFVRLTKLPVRTGSLYFVGMPWAPIPYDWIPGTRTIVLGALENPANYDGSLIMEYFTVDALEINAESPTQGLQNLEVKNPIEAQEIIISGGIALNTLIQTSLALPSLLGPIKRKYQVVCDAAGSLALNPQPILSSVKVLDLVGSTQTINQATLSGAAVYLTLGLTRAIERTTINPTTTYDLDLKVQITGVDTNGTSRVEVLNFKASQWKDQVADVNIEEPLQFLRTAYKYQLVNSITLANTLSAPHNSGPDAVIGLWADVLSGNGNQEFASIASLFWTGTTGINVKDERVIATSFDKLDQKQKRFPTELPDSSVTAAQELFSVILNPPLTNPMTPSHRLMLELDDDRMWSETWNEFSMTWASGMISLVDISLVTIGQTIRIANGKYIKIVASGAVPSLGEVNYNASVDIFKNNMILTINDPLWDSTWFASLGTGATPPVMLAREDAYPEGLVNNTRKKLLFYGPFLPSNPAANFSLDINGITVGPVVFTTDNNTTITAISTAINAAEILTGGITAEVVIPINPVDPYSTIILNGDMDGHDFIADNLVSLLGAPSADILLPLDTFVLAQPVGGKLPTPHLPQRYPNALQPWAYLSRPFLWEGVWLEASIKISGNNPALIGDYDAIEIAPSKIILARVGAGANADPTIGQFLVDQASISNTLNNLIATVNHPVFASGILAEIVGTEVFLRSNGMASNTLRLISSIIPGTWVLTSVGGVTQYVPKGAGHGNAFLKALRPLDRAEWRFVTVEDMSLGWSPWTPLAFLSPTAFTLAAPPMKSLYQIQLRLESAETNSFALYGFTPEVSDVTMQALAYRLAIVEADLLAATGTSLSLNDRISTVVEPDGTPIQDPELTKSHISVIMPDNVSLKEHLDVIDTRLYFASFAGTTPHGVATNINSGLPQLLISGPVDTNDNSQFISNLNPKVLVGGNTSYPFMCQINGYTYKYTRQVELDFTGQTPATYYVYLEEATPYGLSIATGSVLVAEGDSLITDLSANFTLSGVKAGHLLYMPGITVAGQPLVIPVATVSPTVLTLSGRIPSALSSASYTIYNPREGTISYHSGTKTVGTNRLYLGEVTWTGSSLSSINYRYLNKYTSPITKADAVSGSYTQAFYHNLGFIPSSFTIYFYEEVAGTYSGDPKVLQIGEEAVVKTTKYVMTIKNRYANLVARTFSGTAKDVGYIQLII